MQYSKEPPSRTGKGKSDQKGLGGDDTHDGLHDTLKSVNQTFHKSIILNDDDDALLTRPNVVRPWACFVPKVP